MKKSDIKAGVVYGYAQGTSEWRSAAPVIVLDTRLWTWSRPNRGEGQQYKVSNEKKYAAAYNGWSSYSGPHGYLVLHGTNRADTVEQAEHLAEMKVLYTEFAATAGDPDAVNALAAKVKDTKHVTLRVVNNRWISGDYAGVKHEEDERAKARQAERKAERDRAAAEVALLSEVAEVMSDKLEQSVSIYTDRTWGTSRGSINLDDLAAYFGVKPVRDRL